MKRTLVAAIPAGCRHCSQAPARDAGPKRNVARRRRRPGSGGAGPGPVVVVEKDQKKNDTTRELEDGGLGLEWLYLNADVGGAFTDLVSLKSSNWQLQDNSASGPAFGLGAGVRLVFLSAGFRVRDLQLSSFNLWETDLEAALHFRIWRFDLYLGARGGYAFLGSFSADSLRTSTGSAASDVTVHGWNVGPIARTRLLHFQARFGGHRYQRRSPLPEASAGAQRFAMRDLHDEVVTQAIRPDRSKRLRRRVWSCAPRTPPRRPDPCRTRRRVL